MPDGTAFCIDLLASRRARRLRLIARTLTLVAAVSCAAAVLLDASPLRVAAALASIAALVLAFYPRGEATLRRLAVDASGTIRAGQVDAEHTAIVRYCGRQLVCLEASGRRLTVWPDSVSPSHWRRLIVACRWPRRPADDRPPPPGLRTK